MLTLVFPLILIIILLVAFICCNVRRNDTNVRVTSLMQKKTDMFKLFDDSSPGLLITMLKVEHNTDGTPDLTSINVNRCIKLGSISKPKTNIIDFTLLNKRLPINIYHADGFGIILNTKQLIPPSEPDKYIQCCGLRDRGSDQRRCDTDFNHNLNHSHSRHHTIGKYNGLPLRSNKHKCNCVYGDMISNTCNTKAEVVGCGAKCQESGKICGQVDWCTAVDFNAVPKIDGIGCAIHPRDMEKYIDATVQWNKTRIEKKWDVRYHENELDAYVANTPENQKMIIDSIEAFVFTEDCGCQLQMETAVNDFNRFYNKNLQLYKFRVPVQSGAGAYRRGWNVQWQDNNFTSDLRSILEPIELHVENFTRPNTMYTYRIAETVDGIAGKNTGDIKGDNAYISGEFCSRHGDEFCRKSVMSKYKVDYMPINPAYTSKNRDDKTCTYDDSNDCDVTRQGFGYYAVCNKNGDYHNHTGKYECTNCDDDQVPEYERTCKNSPGVELDRFSGGEWLSWPREAECTGDIGEGGCTWKSTFVDSKRIEDLDGYKLLLNDEYDKIAEGCRHHHECIKKGISEHVENNADHNIQILKKSFNVNN